MNQWVITSHWTAGGYAASETDLKHYMAVTEGSGRTVRGQFAPEDNIPPNRPGKYAAHTFDNNSRNIGLACCGMRGASWTKEGVEFGDSPITEHQFEEHCKLIANYALEYNVPVKRGRIDTHAEVEVNRGVKQKGKWDIAFLQFKPELRGARAVGDYMRSRVSYYLSQLGSPLALPADIDVGRGVLRFGDRGSEVKVLQADLADLRYFAGRIDGDFGRLTRAAVLAFQADHDLETDGIVGARTWATMAKATPKPDRTVSREDLTASGTMRDMDMVDKATDATGIGATVAVVAQAREVADQAGGLVETLKAIAADYWPYALGGIVAYLAIRGITEATRKRRLEDARSYRHLGR